MTPREHAIGYAAALRRLSEWIVQNADEVDASLEDEMGSIRFYAKDAETFAALVEMIGPGERNDDAEYVRHSRRFGPIEVYAYASGAKVGQKVTRVEMRPFEVMEWKLNNPAEVVA